MVKPYQQDYQKLKIPLNKMPQYLLKISKLINKNYFIDFFFYYTTCY
jgi:hypothetical protein